MPRLRSESKYLDAEDMKKQKVNVEFLEGTGRQSQSPPTLLSCGICLEFHSTVNCSLFTDGVRIPDSEVLPRAIASIPPDLEAKETDNGSYEIIAKRVIREGTHFGPFEAPTVLLPQPWDSVTGITYAVGDKGGEIHYLDLSVPSECNWMALVRFRMDDDDKSNCICYQLDGRIYFLVRIDINIGSALVVTYSPGYRKFMSSLAEKGEEAPSLRLSTRTLRKRNKSEHVNNEASSPKKALSSSGPVQLTSEIGGGRVGKTKRKFGKRKVPAKVNAEDERRIKEERQRELDRERRETLKRLGPCFALDEWNCKFCSTVFGSMSEFASHLILHYKLVGVAKTEKARVGQPVQGAGTGKDDTFDLPTFPYTCDICEREKTFNRAEYMIRHLSKHAPWSNCESCGETKRGDLHKCSSKSGPGSYECTLCSARLNTASSLSSHLLHKHKDGRIERELQRLISTTFTCPGCHKRFGSKGTLDSHTCRPTRLPENKVSVKIEEREEEEPVQGQLFTCDVCDEAYDEEGLLEGHKSLNRPSPCPFCHKKIDHNKIKIHRKVCQNVQDYSSGKSSVLECPECHVTEADVEEFRTHLGSHTHPLMCQACQLRICSPDQLKHHQCTDFPCDGCVDVFESFLDLRHHIKSIHEKADFYCYECALPFCTEDGYRSHTRCEIREEDEHVRLPSSGNEEEDSDSSPRSKKRPKKRYGSQDGDYVCEVCGAPYTKFSSLKTHRRTHDPKRYECTTCGKQFHRRELLAEHHYVHLPAQFPCSTCGKMFKTRKAMDVHSRIHDGLKNHVCDYEGCGKAFVQKANLVTHRTTHLPIEAKIIECPYCHKHLASKETASVHIRSHEEKQFRCEICLKEFLRPGMLRRHMEVSHGTHRYACQFCPAVVKQKTTFIRHLQKRHPEFMDVWREGGYVESRFAPFTPSTTSKSSSRRRPMMIFLGPDRVTEDNENEILIEGVEENIIGGEPENEIEVEYHSEENLMLTTEEHGSELLLLRLNQDGEFVLSLGNGEEGVEVGEGDFPETEMGLTEGQ